MTLSQGCLSVGGVQIGHKVAIINKTWRTESAEDKTTGTRLVHMYIL